MRGRRRIKGQSSPLTDANNCIGRTIANIFKMYWKQSTAATTLLVIVASRGSLAGAPLTCDGTLALSCHNTTAQTDTCCFNAPGGSLLQTQFWDYNPSIGLNDSWGIHGLWVLTKYVPALSRPD